MEKRDLISKTYLTPSEWTAIKHRRETMGLTEAAYLRMLALQDVDRSARQQLLRENGFSGRPEDGP